MPDADALANGLFEPRQQLGWQGLKALGRHRI
jgi:hypothetical protein